LVYHWLFSVNVIDHLCSVVAFVAEASHRHITAERKTAQVRQETRARLLRAVQQTYQDVFERAQIAPAHVYRLKKSADQALDHTDVPVCDWKYLDESCQLPAWLHWLQRCDLDSVCVRVMCIPVNI